MHYRSVKGFTPLSQLGILFLFLFVGFILAAIVQLVIGMQMIGDGVSIENMSDALMKAMLDPANVEMARLAQVTGTFFLLFVPVVLYSLITNGKNVFWLGFNKHINLYQVLLGFMIIYAATIFAAPIADLTKEIVGRFPNLNATAIKWEAAYNEQVLVLSNLRNWPEFFVALAIMAFFPALFEEVFFRPGLQNILTRWMGSPIFAIIITALLFSLIHMSIYLFLSRAILGFVLGLMYHKTKNVWVNVIAHFLNNAFALSQLFWLSMQKKKLDITHFDPKVEWWLGVLALAGLIVLFYLLKFVSRSNKAKIDARENLLYAANTHDPFKQKEISGS